jgi:2-succinyl-6-hydroxy-2,4-cyclohexadiene-1-carboxylate synthase
VSGPRRLLALHGFTGSGATWDLLTAALPGMLVEAPDLPGHAGTAAGPLATVASTAGELARALTGPVDLLGYSLGARIALRLAIAHPGVVRRLVLEAPSAGIADPAARAERRAADEERARLLERDGLAAFLEAWEREPVIAAEADLPADVRARQRAIRESHDPAGLAASLRAAGQGAMEPLHARLAEVTAPTLVIVGAEDSARARAEEVARGIPGARLAVVPRAGHAVHLHQPDAFVALVRDFVEEPPR